MIPPTTVIVTTHGLEPALSVFPALRPWWQLIGPVYSLSTDAAPAPLYKGCAGHLRSRHGGHHGAEAFLKVQEQFKLMLTLPGERFAIFEYDSFMVPIPGWDVKLREVLMHDGLSGVVVPFSLRGEPGEPCVHFPWFVTRPWLEKLSACIQRKRYPAGAGGPDRLIGEAARECHCPMMQLDLTFAPPNEDPYLPGTILDPLPRGYAARYERMTEGLMLNILWRISKGAFLFHGLKQA